MGADHKIASIPLPATTAEFLERRKSQINRSLNDLVEELHLQLFENEKYRGFLEATYNEDALEGSLHADDHEAARILRLHAREVNCVQVKDKKIATIAKVLNKVLAKYDSTRRQRRNTVGGEVVKD